MFVYKKSSITVHIISTNYHIIINTPWKYPTIDLLYSIKNIFDFEQNEEFRNDGMGFFFSVCVYTISIRNSAPIITILIGNGV